MRVVSTRSSAVRAPTSATPRRRTPARATHRGGSTGLTGPRAHGMTLWARGEPRERAGSGLRSAPAACPRRPVPGAAESLPAYTEHAVAQPPVSGVRVEPDMPQERHRHLWSGEGQLEGVHAAPEVSG